MTGELAVDWGLADRGTLEEGKAADIVIFNSDTVSVGKEEFIAVSYTHLTLPTTPYV